MAYHSHHHYHSTYRPSFHSTGSGCSIPSNNLINGIIIGRAIGKNSTQTEIRQANEPPRELSTCDKICTGVMLVVILGLLFCLLVSIFDD